MECSRVRSRVRIKNDLVRIFLAEVLGTFILVTIGNCAVSQSALYPGNSVIGFLSVNFGYSLAVGFGIYISFSASGGHVNPSITLGFAILGLVKWSRVPLYFIAQVIGAFLSSPVVYGFHYEALHSHDGGNRTVTGDTGTAGLFVVHPPDIVSTWSALGQTIGATAVFLICVAAVVDERNSNPQPGLIPYLVAMIVLACGLAFGGTCLNPARDLGPRMFIAVAGWGVEAFSFRDHNWFWIPTVGSLLGSAVGAFVYKLMVSFHWPENDTTNKVVDVGGEKAAPVPITDKNQPLDEVSALDEVNGNVPSASPCTIISDKNQPLDEVSALGEVNGNVPSASPTVTTKM